MIKLTNVNKYYRQGTQAYHVLKDINLQVAAGEFVAIMGKSGSGKSTLINIIGFFDDQFSGQYQFNKIQVNQLKRNQFSDLRNQQVGFIFQNFKLINNLTVAENVGLPLIYAGARRSQIQARVQQQLKAVGLPNVAQQLPTNLSGGQQQRVSIARALITQPSFLIADEPTGALDSKTSQEILNIFQTLNHQGTTIIMVTHDEAIAERSDRIIRILDGQITSDQEVDHAHE